MIATQFVQSVQGPFHCYHDMVGQALRSGQFWDQQIQPTLDEVDHQGWAIDLGANIGWFTCYLAQRCAGVVAVEAHPVTFELLQMNLYLRGLAWPQVQIHNVAAYAIHTPLTLAPPECVGWPIPDPVTLEGCPHPASVAFLPAVRGQNFRVRGMPIDALIAPSCPVSLIKVDVQGCDLKALEGLTETITRCRPLIVFEYEEGASAWHGDTWDDYLAFFATHRYTVTRIREDLWDFVARPEI